jgi:hypothetical protein
VAFVMKAYYQPKVDTCDECNMDFDTNINHRCKMLDIFRNKLRLARIYDEKNVNISINDLQDLILEVSR